MGKQRASSLEVKLMENRTRRLKIYKLAIDRDFGDFDHYSSGFHLHEKDYN